MYVQQKLYPNWFELWTFWKLCNLLLILKWNCLKVPLIKREV